MKYASIYLYSSILVWLSLVILLIGNLWMGNTVGACTPYNCGDNQGHNYEPEMPLQLHVPRMFQTTEVQLAAAQPGRLGVTEQPGRRGATEQPGRPGAEPDQATHKPMVPSDPPRPIIVDALLNRQVAAPLMLDTGATYTVLTKQTADDLGITGLDRLPKQSFLTPGGRILSPVTTLKSIRVGTVEAQNVSVAIDIDGHLPLGLLGMTFMRYFKVSVDQAQGQVKFERR